MGNQTRTSKPAAAGGGADTRPPARQVTALPEGTGLISLKTLGDAMELSESTMWDWASKDPAFPKLIRMGARCTRVQLSDARDYIARLASAETEA